MANDLLQDPLIIDTAAATSLRAGPVRLWAVKWVPANGAVAGNACVIQDKTSARNVYEHILGTGLLPPPTFEIIDVMVKGGIAVTTLDSGRLYLYLGSGGLQA